MSKKGLTSRQFISLLAGIFAILAFAMTAFMVFLGSKYTGLSIKTFLAVGGILLCVLTIVVILFYVGFRYRDKAISITSLVLSILLFIISTVGSAYLYRINKTVNNITGDSGTEQYETIGVNYTILSSSNTIKELKDISGKKVGSVKVFDGSIKSPSTLGLEKLNKENINFTNKEYDSTSDLFTALIGGEVDVALLPTGYKTIYSSTEPYSAYIGDENETHVVDIDSVTEKIRVSDNKSANLDLSTKPFSILLIGLAEELGGGGLPDAIILATVNPQTMTVSMVSIARDSYVPIPCAGNRKDKINSTGTNRQCLLKSVSQLLDTDIDLYMQVNFKAVVDIVDALGGIWIDSPVEFVGQDSSVERGNKTVWVGQGGQMANGEQALAFARERHNMPNGDFDRQKHQKEVIAQIVEKMMALRDVNKALKIMEIAGDNFSTNLSTQQLISVFNYLVNAKNYTGLSNFHIIDIQNLRITGYDSWYYNYGMQLPLWIYRLYDGSVAEVESRIDEVLGEYDSINQTKTFKFFYEYPYSRGNLYSDYFNEPQIHEEMPLYVPHLERMTYSEVLAWATANGVNLEVNEVDGETPGTILSYSPAYGRDLTDNKNVTITVVGPLDGTKLVKMQNFLGKKLDEAIAWANANGVRYDVQYIDTTEDNLVGLIKAQDIEADKTINTKNDVVVFTVYRKLVNIASLNLVGMSKDNAIATLKQYGIYARVEEVETDKVAAGLVTGVKENEAYSGSTVTLYVAKEVAAPTPTPTPTVKPDPEPGTSPDPVIPPTEPTNPEPPESGGGTEGQE